jgi:predicted restriction endonuclease
MDPERDHQELLENGREAVRSQVVDERGRPIPSKKLQENSKSGTSLEGPLYDTFQDIYVIDSLIYDHVILKSLVKVSSGIVRDLRIRKTVLHRSKGRCERCGFIAGETGLLEVHHIIPAAAKEDRYDNCVALCSNCHRLAHLEPRCKEFEKELLTIVRGLVSSVEGARKTPVK